jgi:hypothetical protein
VVGDTLGFVLEFSFEEGGHALDELVVGDVVVCIVVETTKYWGLIKVDFYIPRSMRRESSIPNVSARMSRNLARSILSFWGWASSVNFWERVSSSRRVTDGVRRDGGTVCLLELLV